MRGAGAGRTAAVVVAGGRGTRIGGAPKQFREVGGRPLVAWSLARFAAHPGIDELVVVVPAGVAAEPPAWLASTGARVAAGGDTRRASVRAGLAALTDARRRPDAVLVHDAARPFASAELVDRVLGAVFAGPVIPVLPLPDTIKRMRSRRGESATVDATLDRAHLRAAQTPQGFPFELIQRLHEQAARDGIEPPDDAALCEMAGVEVRAVEGEQRAWKITRPEDLELAEWLVATERVRWPERGA